MQNAEPIGSKQLKVMYDISYSPATIRGYFKKLGEDGYLVQEHISSGRIPTKIAMQEYWLNHLDLDIDYIDYDLLKELISELQISAFIKYEKDEYLNEIYNIKDKFIVLEFNSFAISIKYHKALYKFLNEMINFNLKDIIHIANEVGANEIKEELVDSVRKNYYDRLNYKEFLRVCVENNLSYSMINSFENGTILSELQKGFYFDLLPSNHMGIVLDTMIDGNESKLLIVGSLNKNYEYLFQRIANGR